MASRGNDISANSRALLFQESTHTTRPSSSHTKATSFEVLQSQLTSGDSLLDEHPHGLDAITKADQTRAAVAATMNAAAIRFDDVDAADVIRATNQGSGRDDGGIPGAVSRLMCL